MAIELISKIKPKGGGTFAMVDAEDVEFKGKRLSDFMPVCLTQAEYDALVAEDKVNDTTPYLICEE